MTLDIVLGIPYGGQVGNSMSGPQAKMTYRLVNKKRGTRKAKRLAVPRGSPFAAGYQKFQRKGLPADKKCALRGYPATHDTL